MHFSCWNSRFFFFFFHLNLGAFLSLRNKKLLALSAATFTHWKNMHLNNQTAIWSHLQIPVHVEFEAIIQCNLLHSMLCSFNDVMATHSHV